VFHHSVIDFLRDLPGGAKRFWAMTIATGAAAGLGAALLVTFLKITQRLLWPAGATFLEAVTRATPVHRVLVLVGAGLVVTCTSMLLRAPLGGHGTAGILEAIWLRSGRLAFMRALLRGVVSIFAVGAGAPLGREGALITVGAATGSSLGRRLRIPTDQVRLLVACGASAGIAGAYNVPIGGALFGLEVLLGSFALELFGPIVVACVTATLLSRILLGNHPSYVIPHYALGGPRDLALFLLLGPAFGVASAVYVTGIDVLGGLADRVPVRPRAFLPPLALGLVGATAVSFPQILGNGYDVADLALTSAMPLGLLVGLPLLKLGATGVSSASGVPGGLFTPSLFYGALLGGAAGHLAHRLLPGTAPAGAYALVGMGAVLAGTTHAAVSAVIIIFELTGDYDVILPVMLACVLSAGVSRRLQPRSLYAASLARRKVQLPELNRAGWLRAVRVAAILSPRADTIAAGAPFREVVMKLLAIPHGRDLYVVDPGGRYLGTIVLDRLKGTLPDARDLEAVVAADVMEKLAPIAASQSFTEAAARFAETDLDKLPVVHPATGELLGVIAKGELMRHAKF
jgi:CIC family chloride channel protein